MHSLSLKKPQISAEARNIMPLGEKTIVIFPTTGKWQGDYQEKHLCDSRIRCLHERGDGVEPKPALFRLATVRKILRIRESERD